MSKHKLVNAASLARSANRRVKRWRLMRVGIIFSALAVATFGGWSAFSANRNANAESLAEGKSDSFINVNRRNRDERNKNDSKNNDKHNQSKTTPSKPIKPDAKSPAVAATNGVKGTTGGAAAAATGVAATVIAVPPSSVAVNLHQNVTTTVFWAGEAADSSNANISNSPSAWDDIWSTHFGGYDDPAHRNGWYPAAFTPKENPFYIALPYNDYDSKGNRRADANKCSAVTGVSASSTSWCKNAWVKITKGSKTAYAQWQDVGPLKEDDANYVFGTAQPTNTFDSRAGLDTSPAVRDYLSLQDVDKTDWTFVSAASVPTGPWKNIITSSGVYWP